MARLAAATAAWPFAARAQQPAMPGVGFIYGGSADSDARFAVAFRKGFNETGWSSGSAARHRRQERPNENASLLRCMNPEVVLIGRAGMSVHGEAWRVTGLSAPASTPRCQDSRSYVHILLIYTHPAKWRSQFDETRKPVHIFRQAAARALTI